VDLKGKNKRYKSTLQSILIPLALVLIAFLILSPILIQSIQTFYFQQKAEDAALLAKSYANSLQTAIDAEYHLSNRLESTLQAGAVTVAKYHDQFSEEILIELAKDLDVDVIYIYDQNNTLSHSNTGEYIGWQPPAGHPVEKFYHSGLISHIEPIRPDAISNILYKYGYHRFEDNKIVQVGILAQTIQKLYAQFSPQHIIQKLSNESTSMLLLFIDTAGNVIAPSQLSLGDDDLKQMGSKIPIDEHAYSRYQYNDTSYLAFHIPIFLDTLQAGSLLLLYDLTDSDHLVASLALLIRATLFAFFILFAGSLIKTYRKNQRILHIAFHDDLTSLSNLRQFHATVSHLSVSNIACIVLNPINFKLVNMVYGYEKGDEILRQIGHSLTTLTKQYPELCAYKFTDDRFLLTFSNYKNNEQIEALCKQVLQIKQKTKLFNTVELCMGISLSTGAHHDSTKLIKHASIALNATSVAKPIQFFNKELEEQLLRKDRIEQDLRSVIQGEKDILRLVYQPIYDAKSSKLEYFEALARMQSSSLGPISPLEFISIAEQRHLIVPLGLHILSLACDFIIKARANNLDNFRVAINISTLQLMDQHFISSLLEMLEIKKIPLHYIELELTESIFAQDLHYVGNTLKELRKMGIRIAIDDFGTGYSSFSRLEHLDIDILKLDKQFVDKLSTEEDKDLAQIIISMAHHIDKQVVAEGVETSSQHDKLCHLGCDYLQGFHLSKPLEDLQALAVLMNHEKERTLDISQ